MMRTDDRSTPEQGASDSPSIRWLVATSGLILLLFLAWWLATSKEWINGPFGDAFGSLNSLFSGLAFAGIIYTVLLQRHELKLQRRELALTREVHERAANAQENAERAMREELEAGNRAYIRISLEPGVGGWYLLIENTGRTTASDLTLLVDKPIVIRNHSTDQRPIDDLPIFSGNKFALPAGEKLSYFAPTSRIDDHGNETIQPESFLITATYKVQTGTTKIESFELNSMLREGTSSRFQRDPLVLVAEEIRNLRQRFPDRGAATSSSSDRIVRAIDRLTDTMRSR